MGERLDISSMNLSELETLLSGWGQPAFRAGQIFAWLHRSCVMDFADMSNLPAALRDRLEAECAVTILNVERAQHSRDGTAKYLLRLSDGNCIETVALRYGEGLSVCISTQVGCDMGCTFCASALGGRVRNLTAGEMLAQVYAVSRETNLRVDHVILMGIGEPLDNFLNVTRFCDLITHAGGYNLAGRNLTISTCGMVPEIRALAAQKRQLTLAVSLHAADDETRTRLMPVNRRYPIGEVMAACRDYFAQTGRRVTFEYAVIHGENDSDAHADALAKLLQKSGAHVNLIPVNAARGGVFRATREDAQQFAARLRQRGLNATVRRTLGNDIDAACGQLRQKAAQLPGT